MKRASAFVLAYHGCDEAVGEKVLAGKDHLKASENDYDWLGTGIYFWENSAQRAIDWAAFAKENPQSTRTRITKPFVLGAVIDLGNCLDLLEATSIGLVEEGYRQFRENCLALEIPLPKNRKVRGEIVGLRRYQFRAPDEGRSRRAGF